jgi:hypothetical protein
MYSLPIYLLPKVIRYLPIAIILNLVENITLKNGVKGMHPLDCLPFWGREGVTLIAAAENGRTTGKKGFPMKIMIIGYNKRRFVVYHCDERRRPRGGLSD